MKIEVEITGSPARDLRPGAAISGHLAIVNTGAKKVKVTQVSASLVECWKDLAPPTRAQAVALLPDHWLEDDPAAREGAIARTLAGLARDNEERVEHQEVVLFSAQKRGDRFDLSPEARLEYDFTLAMPKTWRPRPNPAEEWHFEVRAFLNPNGKDYGESAPLVVPVAGSQLLPSWRFEGDAGIPMAGGATEWVCPSCGQSNPLSTKFCGECG